MEDDGGVDAKLVAVPVEKLCPMYKSIQKLEDLPELLRNQMVHFFEHYKDLEKGKWVKIQGWARWKTPRPNWSKASNASASKLPPARQTGHLAGFLSPGQCCIAQYSHSAG
ncbi:Inorganic pyrophosphatase [Chromobacterium violaceum]|uniref:inorganic diphosphatase n=1 Tax=Chromobacterium violaceum TaxID=536 RepID=A0A3S4JZU2_CHRVL|nr:Inorganic pyrophosphatase [Chromobacterium violaceum]